MNLIVRELFPFQFHLNFLIESNRVSFYVNRALTPLISYNREIRTQAQSLSRQDYLPRIYQNQVWQKL